MSQEPSGAWARNRTRGPSLPAAGLPRRPQPVGSSNVAVISGSACARRTRGCRGRAREPAVLLHVRDDLRVPEAGGAGRHRHPHDLERPRRAGRQAQACHSDPVRLPPRDQDRHACRPPMPCVRREGPHRGQARLPALHADRVCPQRGQDHTTPVDKPRVTFFNAPRQIIVLVQVEGRVLAVYRDDIKGRTVTVNLGLPAGLSLLRLHAKIAPHRRVPGKPHRGLLPQPRDLPRQRRVDDDREVHLPGRLHRRALRRHAVP